MEPETAPPPPSAGPTPSSSSSSSPDLPRVLLLYPPSVYRTHESSFSTHFNFIKPYTSPLSLPLFLSTLHDSSPPPPPPPITALLSSGAGPPITSPLLDLVPSLRCIVTTSAGVNHVDLVECKRRGIVVANAGDVFSEDVADCAVGLVIDVMRKVSAGERFVREGMWRDGESLGLGMKVTGKRVGIVGLGKIGSKVAERLEAFDCRIFYSSRKMKPDVSYVYCSDIYELAEKVDILVICCALTEQTKRMVNKEVFAKLGKDGVIVNIARGAIIDEKELVRCLVEKKIAGAGLDVFEHEPNVPKELFALDNVVLSPHRAVFTSESFQDMYEHVTGNLKAFFAGKPLLSPYVDD